MTHSTSPAPPELRLTPEQFSLLCAENREAVLERAADGRVLAMTPTGSETDARNSRIVMRLLLWADQAGGWKLFGSSRGFRLPLAARLLRRSWLRPQPGRFDGASNAGRRSHPNSAAAFHRSARIWWWNWPAPVLQGPGASAPFAGKWPLTSAMVPSWAGC